MQIKKFKDLKNEYLEPISYFGKNFDNKFHMAKHSHPYIEIMYCHSGRFNFEVEETNSKNEKVFNVYPIHPSELVFIDTSIYHRIFIGKTDKAHIYNLEFEIKPRFDSPFGINEVLNLDYSKLLASSKGLNKLAFSNKGYAILVDTENLGSKIQQLLDVLSGYSSNFEEAFAACIGIYELLVGIGKCSDTETTFTGITYIKKAMEYIKKNYSTKITIDEIAYFAGVNKSYLQRLFKSNLNTSVYKAVNSCRIESCKKMLESSNLPIEEICAAVGFDNRQQLNYEFKLATGIAPTSYRKAIAKRQIDHKAALHNSVFIEDEEEKLYNKR